MPAFPGLPKMTCSSTARPVLLILPINTVSGKPKVVPARVPTRTLTMGSSPWRCPWLLGLLWFLVLLRRRRRRRMGWSRQRCPTNRTIEGTLHVVEVAGILIRHDDSWFTRRGG